MTNAPHPSVPVPSQSAGKAQWLKALPLVAALALVGFVVSRLDLTAFVAQLTRLNCPLYLGFAAAFVGALLLADAFATTLIYRRTVAPVPLGEMLALRGASYLPSIVNHHLGQAFITYFLSRAYGVTLWRTAGATMLIYISWMAWLVAIMSSAIVALEQPKWWLVAPLGAVLGYLTLLKWRPTFLSKRALFAPLFDAGFRGHALAVAVRFPHFVVLFLGNWISFSFFAVRIPWSQALAPISILMVAGTLPITPQGIGTRDVLAALFFERFAPGNSSPQRLAAIAAATGSFVIACTLIDAIIGFAMMYWAMPVLRRRIPTQS